MGFLGTKRHWWVADGAQQREEALALLDGSRIVGVRGQGMVEHHLVGKEDFCAGGALLWGLGWRAVLRGVQVGIELGLGVAFSAAIGANEHLSVSTPKRKVNCWDFGGCVWGV